MASEYSLDEITAGYADDRRGSTRSGDGVPSVFVTTPEIHPSQSGRMPSRLPPGHSNFSRPAPPPRPSDEELESGKYDDDYLEQLEDMMDYDLELGEALKDEVSFREVFLKLRFGIYTPFAR